MRLFLQFYFMLQPFYIAKMRLLLSGFYGLYYHLFYRIQHRLYEYLNQGFVDLMILPNIVEFFVYGQAFDKKHSEHASKSLYLAGIFCLLRGFYSWTYVKVDCDPNNKDRIVPFWKMEDSAFVFKAYDTKYGPVFFVDLGKFLKIKELQNTERFVFGKVLTLGFGVSDSQQRLFLSQRWVHSFKLELAWAFLPTVVIFLIIVPSLVLLYSSDVVKMCDECISITANQ